MVARRAKTPDRVGGLVHDSHPLQRGTLERTSAATSQSVLKAALVYLLEQYSIPGVLSRVAQIYRSRENGRDHEGGRGMKLFLDCEFTQLNKDAKLISLALVSEAGDEFYIELTDTYRVKDCSDFVIENVLPQLNLPRYGVAFVEAKAALIVFLDAIEGELEVCSDAPQYDWDFFCQLACVAKWPKNVTNRPTNLIHLFRHFEAEDICDVPLHEPPHHALQDARLLAELYRGLVVTSKNVGD